MTNPPGLARLGSVWIGIKASPGLARAPIIHKRIDRLSKGPPTGSRLSAFETDSKDVRRGVRHRDRGQRPTATEEKRKLGKLKAEIEESRQLATVGPGSADVLVGRCGRIASHPANSNPPTKRSLRRPMRRSFRTRRMLPGGFPGFAPWAGMRCPYRAWGSKPG